MTIKQLDPLEFSFEAPGKPVKTVKIQPIEDDVNVHLPTKEVGEHLQDEFSFIAYLKFLFTPKR